MRLVQTAQHLIEHPARGVHTICRFDLGPKLVVDGLPIQAAGHDLPVLVANGGPHVLERLDVQLALFGSESRLERNS